MSAFPSTPGPNTPGPASAMGWMEDIKRVISFDSVEEFWGYVFNILRLSKKTCLIGIKSLQQYRAAFPAPPKS